VLDGPSGDPVDTCGRGPRCRCRLAPVRSSVLTRIVVELPNQVHRILHAQVEARWQPHPVATHRRGSTG
jgi:hypothetical protein